VKLQIMSAAGQSGEVFGVPLRERFVSFGADGFALVLCMKPHS
jgi:hypothetical protein